MEGGGLHSRPFFGRDVEVCGRGELRERCHGGFHRADLGPDYREEYQGHGFVVKYY